MKNRVELTPSQSVIANHKDGPVIVLAGAGSGKTATLIERCKQLTFKYLVSPSNQLILTFSRKAASEIRNRLKTGLGNQAQFFTVDTFHGFGYHFLRNQKELYGLKEDENWVILDSTDQSRLLMELAPPLLEQAQIDKKKFRPFLKKQFALWSLMKQDVVIPQTEQDAHAKLHAMSHKHGVKVPFPAWLAVSAQTLHAYERYKSENHYLDYDDLLTKPLMALVKYPEIAEALSRRYNYIMVDESQDTNLAQYLLIKHIGKHHGNVIMVGDDDQSIYGWRGARVSNLRKFMQDFGAKEVRLEENFRSQPKIVEAASKLIAHNTSRLVKHPYSKQAGDNALPPALHCFPDDQAMGDMLIKHIQFMRAHRGAQWSDIAILYRTNRMPLLLEPHLKRAGIPYRVVGGMSFFERAEVKAAIQCIRLVEKPNDWEALKNLIPYLDGIGKKGMADAIETMKNSGLSLFDLVEDSCPISGKVFEKLASYYNELLDHTLMACNKYGKEAAGKFIDWLIEGPMKILEREKDDAIRYRRQMNLELLKKDLEANCTDDWMQYFLDTPLSDSVEVLDDEDCITLSTIHRAKGLEWPYVIVAGFSDGLMPFDPTNIGIKADESEDDLEDGGKPEEERRLGYVALTRAEREAHFYHADVYNFPQKTVTLTVSRYAREMGINIHPAMHRAPNIQHVPLPPEDSESVLSFLKSFGRPSL